MSPPIDPVIEVKGLTKVYRLYRSPKDRLKETFLFGMKTYHQDFHALNDISFSVGHGETVGLVGQNGSGKSTLLGMVAGVLTPTTGMVTTLGRVSALLELGTGFNGEFSGRENIYMNGALAGFRKEEMDRRVEEIERFAEIGQFMDLPVKTYSTGMFVRLAFSCAINLSPDILVIDEALAVGDAYFQHKCFAKLKEFKERGVTLIFVSHDAAAIRSLCDRVMLLDEGRLHRDGSPEEVMDYYNALIARRTRGHVIRQETAGQDGGGTRSGNFQARIERVEMVGPGDITRKVFAVGQGVEIRAVIRIQETVPAPTVGFMIRDRLGNAIFGTNSYHLAPLTGEARAGSILTARFGLPLSLGPGNYSLSLAVHAGAVHTNESYDWWDQACFFEVVPGKEPPFVGVVSLPATFSADWSAGGTATA